MFSHPDSSNIPTSRQWRNIAVSFPMDNAGHQCPVSALPPLDYAAILSGCQVKFQCPGRRTIRLAGKAATDGKVEGLEMNER
jgi:hypothetical protein